MDDFTKAYIQAALWSTNDDEGDPLENNYSADDIDSLTLSRIKDDCKRFQEENADDIAEWEGDRTPEEAAGHDFWLTRNGHGTGFWDGDWPEDAGDQLTVASEAFSSFDLYVGHDDGRIYVC